MLNHPHLLSLRNGVPCCIFIDLTFESLEYGPRRWHRTILGRNPVSFHPSGASVYGGQTGSKVCRFEISASTGSMVDLKSLCISGTVFNLDSGNIQFLSPSLSGLLSSARVTVAGVEASSCDHIARTEHMLSLMQSDDVRRSDFNSGFGLADATAIELHGEFTIQPIPAGTSRNAVWKPRSLGVLQCDSYMPLSMLAGNMFVELTFADDPKSGLNTTSRSLSAMWTCCRLILAS